METKSFGAGQIWSYKARSEDISSKLTILKLDHEHGFQIVHIAIDNVTLPDGSIIILPHLPIAAEMLSESVISLISESGPFPPNWEEGYDIWRTDFDAEKAGWFNISPSQIIATVTIPAFAAANKKSKLEARN